MSLFTAEMRRDPYPMYDMLRREPVRHIAQANVWLVLDYDGVKRVLTDHDAFSSNVSPARGHSFEWLLFMDPPRHTQLRGIISKAFTPKSIAALEGRVRELARSLIEPMVARGGGDIATELAAPLPMMVIAEMVGLPLEDCERMQGWSEAIVNLGNTIVGGDAEAASNAFNVAHAEMVAYLDAHVAARRNAPRDDLLTRLIAAELGEPEIVRFVQLLLAAGTETTTNLIDNAVLCLIDHPMEVARDAIPSLLEEVLRYRTPVQAMFRVARREVELSGAKLPAGAFVLAMIGAANRDPAVFADAATFDPRRDPNPHIAFGHGVHFCLGAPLSRLEGRVVFEELLSRVKGFERATTEPWTPRGSFHVYGPMQLPVRFR